MRDYEPIWLQLKLKGTVTVTAHKALHRRVIKAVQKEKYGDLGYKLLLSERGKIARLKYKKQGALLTFTVVESIGLEDL